MKKQTMLAKIASFLPSTAKVEKYGDRDYRVIMPIDPRFPVSNGQNQVILHIWGTTDNKQLKDHILKELVLAVYRKGLELGTNRGSSEVKDRVTKFWNKVMNEDVPIFDGRRD